MKKSLLEESFFNSRELNSIKGGSEHRRKKVCGCICVGPVEPVLDPSTGPAINDAYDCADCGAVNAYRVKNESLTES